VRLFLFSFALSLVLFPKAQAQGSCPAFTKVEKSEILVNSPQDSIFRFNGGYGRSSTQTLISWAAVIAKNSLKQW
jgi:hypothetical protein